MSTILKVSKHGLNALAFSSGKTNPITSPFKATIELTTKCNARCKFCQRWNSNSPDLLTNEWKRILLDLRDNGVLNVSLSGGEPLLRKDIFELIAYCKETGLLTTINTNGLIVNKYINEIEGSGAKSIYFSLDSHLGEIHDNLRGINGIFDSAVENMKRMTKNGKMKVYINSVVTHENFRDIGNIIGLAKEIGVDGIGFAPVHDFKDGNFAVKDELKNIDWEVFEKQIINLETEFSIYPLSYYKRFQDFWSDPEKLYKNMRCVAGYMQIHIGPDGSVYPCQSMFVKMGSLKEDSFKNIWISKKAQNIREDIKKNMHPKCWAGCIGGPNLMLNNIFMFGLNRQYITYLIKSKFGVK